MPMTFRRPGTVAACLAVILAFAVAVPSADAAVVAQGAATRALTDGHRLVAWLARPGVVHVLDVASGDAFDTDVGVSCLNPVRSLISVGGGEVLFACAVQPLGASFAREEPRLLDVASRTVLVPEGAARVIDES